LRDFRPEEGVWLEGCAVAIAGRDVIHNRPLMTLRPCTPLELHRISRVDIGIKTTGRSALVAIYISCAHSRWLHEPNVLVERVPASGLGTAIGWVVEPYWIGAVGPCSFDVDARDEAVGRDGGEEGGGGGEEDNRGKHLGGKMWLRIDWEMWECFSPIFICLVCAVGGSRSRPERDRSSPSVLVQAYLRLAYHLELAISHLYI
jgi:hypothetical protein